MCPPGTRYPPPKTRYTPQDQVHPPDQVPPDTRYPPKTRYTPQDQVHPPRPGTPPPRPGTPPRTGYSPPRSRLQNTVNERPVRILLECILVFFMFASISEIKVTASLPGKICLNFNDKYGLVPSPIQLRTGEKNTCLLSTMITEAGC